MQYEDWLWYLAREQANKSGFLKGMRNWSILFFAGVLFFIIVYCLMHLWKLEEGFTYAAICFIVWSGLIHLSDRLHMNRRNMIALSTTDESTNLHSLVTLLIKRRLGIISVIFLVLGFLSEVGNQITTWVSGSGSL